MLRPVLLGVLIVAAACADAPPATAPTPDNAANGPGPGATATDIPLTKRAHMDAATQAMYDRIRSRSGWLLGVGALASAPSPSVPVAPGAVAARWQELYGGGSPASIEWEMAEQNSATANRDWTGLTGFASAGGLPWIRISMNNFTVPFVRGSTPPPQGGMNDTRGGAAAVLPGGSAHDAFVSWAQQLARSIKAVGAPVVLRPLHEGNGNWFWWGGNATNYIALWRQLFDLFQAEGTHNVIWLYAPSDLCSGATCSAVTFYPGDAYVDMLGPDLYFTGGSLPSSALSTLAALEGMGADKPIVIGEFGPGARADFWQQAPGALAAIKRFRGFSLWLARGWNVWPAGTGSLVDASLDTATQSAFAAFLAGNRLLNLAAFASGR